MENSALIEKINKSMEESSFRAAYALNMCTVSVSQIVDYEDINVLEQEYEAILNNLNLELMPKDEALLDILKQLLDTITFFRMAEGDKKVIEKEYEYRMKNAIWSAVPNFGMIFAGGVSPVALGVSLASQIGIGYMNYRKNKAEYELDKDKEYWRLQRAAIEQFNALKRELFTTAWRLADSYKFPDNYRLTEGQIKQYNEILADADELRRFERLQYIEDSFCAYPPYWYFLGHAANEIFRNEQYAVETREFYKEKAISCFEVYCSFYKINILRQDQIMASCALEYIDLLDPIQDKEKILFLLELSKKMALTSKDVLQICAFSYLKICEFAEAQKIFRYLVNEQYNTTLNAQILSQIYINLYLHGEGTETRRNYETLTSRINVIYFLFLSHVMKKWQYWSGIFLKSKRML